MALQVRVAGLFGLVAWHGSDVQTAPSVSIGSTLFLEAFNSVCRGMRDPKTAQSGFDFGQIARLLRVLAAFSLSEPGPGSGVQIGTRAAVTETDMGRGLLLWLIGIPLPIILVVWLLGGLH
jgi:hypothetical protein